MVRRGYGRRRTLATTLAPTDDVYTSSRPPSVCLGVGLISRPPLHQIDFRHFGEVYAIKLAVVPAGISLAYVCLLPSSTKPQLSHFGKIRETAGILPPDNYGTVYHVARHPDIRREG